MAKLDNKKKIKKIKKYELAIDALIAEQQNTIAEVYAYINSIKCENTLKKKVTNDPSRL